MDFHAGIIDRAEGSAAQVADAGGAGADENNLVFKSARRERVIDHIGDGDVRESPHGTAKIDHHPADIVGHNDNRRTKFQIFDAGRPKVQNHLLVGQAQVVTHGLDVDGGVNIPFGAVLGASKRYGQVGAAHDTVRIRPDVEKTGGPAVSAKSVGQRFDVGLGAEGQDFLLIEFLNHVEKAFRALRGVCRPRLGVGKVSQQMCVAIECGVIQTFQICLRTEKEVS